MCQSGRASDVLGQQSAADAQLALLMPQEFGPVSQFPEIAADKLLRLVEMWLRAEQARERQKLKDDAEAGIAVGRKDDITQATWNNGWAAGRLTSSLKLSSNAVMR